MLLKKTTGKNQKHSFTSGAIRVLSVSMDCPGRETLEQPSSDSFNPGTPCSSLSKNFILLRQGQLEKHSYNRDVHVVWGIQNPRPEVRDSRRGERRPCQEEDVFPFHMAREDRE